MEAISLGAMMRESCRTYPNNVAMTFQEGSEWKTITYRELAEKVRGYSAALKELGVQRGERVAIQSENCPEWALLDWGCQCLGVVLVPIYPTLPPDQTQYIVSDSGAKLVVSSTSEQAAKVSDLPGVQTLLLKGAAGSLAERTASAQLSEEEWNREIDATDPESLATIIYTSGTTGNPKGAMLPHRSITFVCKSALRELPFSESDSFLSFLPMSHVYERVAGQALPISCGAKIAFAKSLMTLASDMQAVKPTIMLCVPRFLEATMDKIKDAVKKAPPLRQKLFGWAVSQGAKKAKGEFAPFAGILDSLVGKKIRERTGGRIRFFVSGGAALPPNVAEFYMAMGLTVLQGYGLTETTAATCVNHPDPRLNKYWTVGPPLPGVEVKIAPDGEILVRGPSVMQGYYNLPEETAAAINGDGWLHTGDIGEFEGPNLKITDRKKDILVLANGKNVAPQHIENRLKESPYITEAVVFGDGNEYVYGLILPNLERAAEKLGSEVTADSAEVKALVKAEVDAVNKNLADFEKVKKHALLSQPFSIESGELTPSLKVKRKVVKERHAETLKGLERG